MKRMNNKGLTLLELIVSFAIVGVAITYFYQTLNTVSKLYSKARTQTNEFANTTYVLRLVDAKLDKIKETLHSPSGKNISFDTSSKNDLSNFCKKIGTECKVTGPTNNFYIINVKYDGKDYELYRRASTTEKVGTVTETWEVKASSVDISKAKDSNHGITYDEKNAVLVETSYNTPGTDCNAPGSGCEKSATATKEISYERRNWDKKLVEEDSEEISKALSEKLKWEWRIFRPCSSYDIVETKDASQTNYGTFTAKGCNENLDVKDLASKLNEKMYIAPIKVGGWADEDKIYCNGVLINYYDAKCHDEKKTILGRKITKEDWLTTLEGHTYNSSDNGSFKNVPHIWEITRIEEPSVVGWDAKAGSITKIYFKKYKVTAETYVKINYTYDVYAYED